VSCQRPEKSETQFFHRVLPFLDITKNSSRQLDAAAESIGDSWRGRWAVNTTYAPAPSSDEIRARLVDHSFLRGLAAEHQQVLAKNAVPVHFRPGEIVGGEGESADRFYLILDGKIAVESAKLAHQHVLIQTFG
jgi:hypothetical protein